MTEVVETGQEGNLAAIRFTSVYNGFIFMDELILKKLSNILYSKCIEVGKSGELPIASIIYFEKENKYYIKSNSVEKTNNPFNHAENNVISYVLKKRNTRYLPEASIITSLEPCLFCFGLIKKVNIKNIYYFCDDKDNGSISHYNLDQNSNINIYKLDDSRFDKLITDCFKLIREKK